jgi:hypothetical protein
MFRASGVEPAPVVQADPVETVPLSVLGLDLPVPAEGWAVFLGARGIAFRSDSIGRDAISAADAQRLIAEQRQNELRKRAFLAEVEREAIEADEQRRAQIWRGVPASSVPEGMSASTAMLMAARDAQPRRRSLVEDFLDRSDDQVVFIPFRVMRRRDCHCSGAPPAAGCDQYSGHQ